MHNNYDWFSALSNVFTIIIAAISGAFGAYFTGSKDKVEYLLSAIFGAVLAICINPLFIAVLSYETGIPEVNLLRFASASGFFIGLFGFVLTGRLYGWIVNKVEEKVKEKAGE